MVAPLMGRMRSYASTHPLMKRSVIGFIGLASFPTEHGALGTALSVTLLFPKKFVLFPQHGDDLIVLCLQFWQNGHD